MKLNKAISNIFHAKNSKILNKNHIILFGIISIGFLLRLYFGSIYIIHGDEQGYMYDANLILKGEIPFKDYHTRSPVFLFLISIFIKIFGQDYYSARLLSVFASTISIFLIYKIGKELFQREVGLIAAFLFAFSPYTLKWGVTLNTEIVQVVFVLLAIFYLIKGIKNENKKYFFINGILLGFAILVRRSTLSWVLGEGLIIFILFFLNTKEDRVRNFLKSIKYYIYILFGISIVILSVLTFFSILTNFSYIYNQFLKSAGIISPVEEGQHLATIRLLNYQLVYIFIPCLLYLLLYLKEKLSWFDNRELNIAIPAIFFLFYIGISINFHSTIFPILLLSIIAITTLPLSLLPKVFKDLRLIKSFPYFALLILITFFFFEVKNYEVYNLPNIVLLIILILLIFYIIQYNNYKINKQIPFLFGLIAIIFFLIKEENDKSNLLEENVIALLIILIAYLSIWILKYNIKIDIKYSYSNIIILIWFLSILGFYSFYGMWKHVIVPKIYWYELTPIFCLMGGIAIFSIFKKHLNEIKNLISLFLILLLISAGASQSMVFNIEDKTHVPSPKTINEVANYIKENTEEDEEIFTGCLAVAFQADRRVVFDISHPYYYKQPEQYVSKKEIRYPSIEELENYLIDKNIRYVVIHILTEVYYFSKNPEFKQFIYENYKLEKRIDYVDILVKK